MRIVPVVALSVACLGLGCQVSGGSGAAGGSGGAGGAASPSLENLLESEIANELQGELNTVLVSQIHVTLLRLDGTPLELDGLPNPYATVTSGIVPPMGAEQPARGAVAAIGVPSTPTPRSTELRPTPSLDELSGKGLARESGWPSLSWPFR